MSTNPNKPRKVFDHRLRRYRSTSDTVGEIQDELLEKQPLDSDLTSIAALPSGPNLMPYCTAPAAWALCTLTEFARSILDDADAAAARATIGAGTSSFSGAFADLSGKPTTLSGYGITDAASDTELSNHESDTTGIHGIADTSALVTTSSVTELAQDAVGAMVDDTLTYVDSTPLLQRAALTGDVTAPAGSNATTIANSAVTEAKMSLADNTTGDVSTTKHGFVPKAPNDTSKFLRGDATWAAPPGGGEAFPVGSVFISVVSTNPGTLLGYGTWAAFGAGRVLVGLDSGDTSFDTVEETGGAKTVAAAGTNSAPTISGSTANESAHTHSVTSNVSVNEHGTHTHNSGTLAGSNVAASVKIGTGATNATGAHTTTITGATAANSTGTSATTHTVNNPAVTSGAGSAHNHEAGTLAASAPTFTGSATSVVQPYIVVYMWKRTA